MEFTTFQPMLQQILVALELDLTNSKQQQLFFYLLLLQKWNKIINLTAITNFSAMLLKHVYDSLLVNSFSKNYSKILDVGTGAGLPGIVLAITNPQQQWYLLESKNKKINFLLDAKKVLSLHNVTIVHTRVEQYSDAPIFDAIISRAFASLVDFITLTKNLLITDGAWLAMKGQYPKDELTAIIALPWIKDIQCIKLHTPLLHDDERHLVIVKKQGDD